LSAAEAATKITYGCDDMFAEFRFKGLLVSKKSPLRVISVTAAATD
jgi:hypothetical protein